MNSLTLSETIAALEATGLPDQFTPEVSRLVIHLLRQIAQGQGVTMGQVRQLAASLDVPDEVATKVVQQMCERDKQGNVVGLLGLSQNEYAHKFHVNGQRLSTWCALDALFLPILLDQTAEVTGRCPVTKDAIYLTISPKQVERYDPVSVVVSVVIPDIRLDSLASVEHIWNAFCTYVHFFSSAQAGSTWFAGKPQTAQFVSVEDAFQIGQALFGKLMEHVRA